MKRMLLISLLLASLPATGATPETYAVQPGDSVVTILRSFGYGDNYAELLPFIEQLVRDNPGSFRRGNPDLLFPGAVLAMPDNPNDPEPEPEPEPAPEPEPEPEPEPVVPVIGQIEVNAGSSAIRRGAEILPVPFREDLVEGDVIVTGAGSLAEIRMLDNTVFRLGPDTEFALGRFEFEQDQGGNVLGGLLATLRLGVLRTITGLLGKGTAGDFELRSLMTATIGIRGTDFTMRACDDPQACGDLFGASVAVQEGGVGLANQSGEVELAEGEFALVQSPAALPEKGPVPEGFFDLSRAIADIEVDRPWWQRSIDIIRSWF